MMKQREKTINALEVSIGNSSTWIQNRLQHIHQWMTVLLEDTKQKNTIAVLDGVRAVACLIVLIFHINYYARETHVWRPILDLGSIIGSVAVAGQSGVALFFVLSGFLLFMPYAKALLFDSAWPSTRIFYLRRAFRIIPAYYTSLFIMILLFHPEYLRANHWKDVGLFLIFFMDIPATYQKINGPFWTLAVEAQFYMLLPLLALGIRLMVQRGAIHWRVVTLTLSLVGVIAWGLLSRYWGHYFLWNPTKTFLVPRSVIDALLPFLYGNSGKYLEDFAVGMLISFCYVFSRNSAPDSRWNVGMRRLSPVLWVLGLLMLSFMALWHFHMWYFGYDGHFLRHFDPLIPYFDQWNEICLSVGFGLCVAAILYGSAWLKRPFEWSPLRWVGLISYSLYMWHVPLISFFADHVIIHLSSGWHRSAEYALYWLWALLVIIPFSLLFFVWIEKPWMKVGEALRGSLEKQKQQRR